MKPMKVSLVEAVFPGRGSLYGNMRLSLLAGDLQAGGHLVRVFTVESTPGGVPSSVLKRFLQDPFAAASDAVVFYRVWPDDLARAVRKRSPRARLCLYESGTPFELLPGVEVVTGGRFSIMRVVEGRAGGRARSAADESGLFVPAARPFRPDLRRTVIFSRGLAPESGGAAELLGRLNCPYRRSVRLNPLFDGLDLPGNVAFTGGCSMCLFRVSRAASVDRSEWVDSIVRQMRWIRENGRAVADFRLCEHAPLDHLDALLARLRREGISDLTLLLDLRVDQLLSKKTDWAAVAALARRARTRLDFACIGFENFSQPELERLNKGTTAVQNVAAVRFLRRLCAQAGDVFSCRHAAAGFILFSPWTTPRDLAVNVRMFRALDFGELCAGLARMRLCLYPEMPLYHLAARDGLLLERLPPGWRRSLNNTAADHPWTFASERTKAVHDEAMRLLGQGRGDDVDALEEALRAAGPG